MNVTGGKSMNVDQYSEPWSASASGDSVGGCQRTSEKPARLNASSWAATPRW